jgi:hypothetical protein
MQEHVPMHRILKTVMAFAAIALIAALIPTIAAAHEHREVADGQYELTVGFLNEPAFVNQQNGLDLRVAKVSDATPAAADAHAGTPVEGLSDTLTAEVLYGDQSMALELEPVYNQPGAYRAIFFPTATGAYSFHISGEIEGNPIDETFTSGPETFSEVEPIEPLQFPKADS